MMLFDCVQIFLWELLYPVACILSMSDFSTTRDVYVFASAGMWGKMAQASWGYIAQGPYNPGDVGHLTNYSLCLLA